jgi:hypothetical protein
MANAGTTRKWFMRVFQRRHDAPLFDHDKCIATPPPPLWESSKPAEERYYPFIETYIEAYSQKSLRETDHQKEDRDARALIGGEPEPIVMSSALIGRKTCISILRGPYKRILVSPREPPTWSDLPNNISQDHPQSAPASNSIGTIYIFIKFNTKYGQSALSQSVLERSVYIFTIL